MKTNKVFEKRKLKYLVDLFNGNSIPDDKKNYYCDKKIPYIPTKSIDVDNSNVNYDNGLSVDEDDGFRIANKDSTLLCIEGGSAGKKICFLEKDVAFVNKLCCFRPCNIEKRYLFYSLQSIDFLESFKLHLSGMIGGVSIAELKNIFITCTDYDTELKISKILDIKCAKLDKIAKNLSRQIEKLEEYKRSLIYEKITKGLTSNLEIKNSNVSWLGMIPSDWNVIRVKDGFFEKKCKAHIENPTVLSLARSGVKIRDISNNEGQIAASYYEYNKVDVDDLLINPMDLYSGANCSISRVDGVISPAYINLRYKNDIDPNYYDYYFKFCYWSFVFFSFGKGVSFDNRWTLNRETLFSFKMPCPPFEDQTNISNYLNKKCQEVDAIINTKNKQLDNLKEYKKRLIYEYVTGKRSVD